jgi:hypothetical protein
MPRHENHPNVEAEGEIRHVFAHRLVVDTGSKPVLAELTPRGLEIVKPRVGDRVALKGEKKPSEIKVSRPERNGETFEIGHGHTTGTNMGAVDPGVAVTAANHAGYRVIGEACRKPKHFEVFGKKGAEFEELHIELDGDVRKTKPLSAYDRKWQSEIERAHAPSGVPHECGDRQAP